MQTIRFQDPGFGRERRALRRVGGLRRGSFDGSFTEARLEALSTYVGLRSMRPRRPPTSSALCLDTGAAGRALAGARPRWRPDDEDNRSDSAAHWRMYDVFGHVVFVSVPHRNRGVSSTWVPRCSAIVLRRSEAVRWLPISHCAMSSPVKPRTTTPTRRSAFLRSSNPPPVSVGRPAHSSQILCTPCGAVRRQPKLEGGSSRRGLGGRLDHERPFP